MSETFTFPDSLFLLLASPHGGSTSIIFGGGTFSFGMGTAFAFPHILGGGRTGAWYFGGI